MWFHHGGVVGNGRGIQRFLCLLSSLGWVMMAAMVTGLSSSAEQQPHMNVHHGGTGVSSSGSWSHRPYSASMCRGGASETTTKEEEEYLDAYVNRLLEESESRIHITTTTDSNEEDTTAPQKHERTVVDADEIHGEMKTNEPTDHDSSELPENIIHAPLWKKETELEMAQDHGDTPAVVNHHVDKSTTSNEVPTQIDDEATTLDSSSSSSSSSKATNPISSSNKTRKKKRKKQAKPTRHAKQCSSQPSTIVDVPTETVEKKNDNRESQEKKEVEKGIQLSPDETGERTNNGSADAAAAVTSNVERKEIVRASTPPNALYRLLLRRGPVGHGVVSIAVVWVEWVELYLPWVAHFLTWVLASLHIYTGPRPIASRNHPNNRPSSVSSRAAHMNAAYAGVVSRPGKVGQVETKKADEVALAKLRTLGTTNSHDKHQTDAKYGHVSTFFLKRHGLGPYYPTKADESSTSAHSSTQRILGESFRETTNGEGGTTTNMASLLEPPEEQDLYTEEQDWVVQALQEGPYEVSSSWNENVLVSPSSSAVRVGLDVRGMVTKKRASETKPTTKRTKVLSLASVDRWHVLEAAAASKRHDHLGERHNTHQRRRPAAVKKTSDRDGGVMGRLRAVGANSFVSRQLLGAYPGDAVPPQQAGSANGVMELARKYGYGDWSDDNDNDNEDNGSSDEEDDFWNPPKQTNRSATKSASNRVKRTRRRKRSSPHSSSNKKKKQPDTSTTSTTTSSFSVGVEKEWTWGGGDDDSTRIKRGERKSRIKRTRSKRVDSQRTRPARKNRSEVKQEEDNDSTFSFSSRLRREGIATMKQTAAKGPGVVRPPMQRLDEAQGKAAVTRMKQTLAEGHRSVVRSPMQRLGEAQRKARQESKDDQES
eukprot:scaffold367_cov46-Attheya_sp.AAC.2